MPLTTEWMRFVFIFSQVNQKNIEIKEVEVLKDLSKLDIKICYFIYTTKDKGRF
jgi:hypothetical protein